jgi:predicted enzyme related to lactoylglutathione lyase
VAAAFRSIALRGAKQLQPPTELTSGFLIASVVDPFGNVLGLRLDPDFS